MWSDEEVGGRVGGGWGGSPAAGQRWTEAGGEKKLSFVLRLLPCQASCGGGGKGGVVVRQRGNRVSEEAGEQ